MKIYSSPRISDEKDCPYIEGNKAQDLYFFADDLDESQWDFFVSQGFRKFGQYFFKPRCPSCQKCQSIRVKVEDFKPSKSQRRVLNKNKTTLMSTSPLVFEQEIYDLYIIHSQEKFDCEKFPIATRKEFIQSHFTKTTPSLITKYKLGDVLIAVGFLDVSINGLSSVYFIYNPSYSHLSLGTLGAIKEINLAKEMGKSFYYLGYLIEDNQSMNYKSKFLPYELLINDHWQDPK